MHILHCTPLGTSMFGEFIRRIHAEGAMRRAGRTALLLPSPFLLEQARTELRKADLPAWEFPQVLSLDEMADSLSGLRKISRVEQELILTDIIRRRQDERFHHCFGKVLDFSGFVSSLARLFDELKMASVSPDELESAWEAIHDETEMGAVRDEVITELFNAYHRRLESCDVVDLAGSYMVAVNALEQDARALPLERIFMAEFSVLSPLRLSFVEALKRKTTMEMAICFEKDRSEVFSAVEPIYQALVGMGFTPVFHSGGREEAADLFHIRRNIFMNRATPEKAPGNVSFILAPDKEREIAAAADRIKEMLISGACVPGEIAVVVREPEAYPDMRRNFLERGIPVDLPESMDILCLAISKLVFAWLELTRGSGDRKSVMPVLKSPYIADKLGLNPDELEAVLLDEIILGWDDWDAAFERRRPDAETGEVWSEGLLQLKLKVDSWRKPLPWRGWAQRLSEFILWLETPEVLRRRRAMGMLDLLRVRAELSAMEALMDASDQCSLFGGLLENEAALISAGDFAEALERMLKDKRMVLSGRDEAGVRIVAPGTASGMQFPVVIVMGLTEGEFPALPRESWLYDDRSRHVLGEAGVFLTTAAQRAEAEDFQFAIAVAMATKKLILSAVSDSESLPSRYMEEVTRLFEVGGIVQQQIGPQRLTPEKIDEAWSKFDLMRGALAQMGQGMPSSGEWQQIFDALEKDLPEYLTERASIEVARKGPFGGMISSKLMSASRFSASELERYAACPFAYFATDVLSLKAWDESEAGIDSLSKGTIWHEVLSAFLGRYRGRSLISSNRAGYVQELEVLLKMIVDNMRDRGKLVPDAWWKFEQPRYIAAMTRWLETELETQQEMGAIPSYFEWSFGLDLRPGSDSASTENPFLIGQGDKAVYLQGKIDRIDRMDTGYRLIDYKTGQAPKPKEIEQGLRLQVPVYMMAAEALLGKTVVHGEYQPVYRPESPLILPGKKVVKQDLFASTEHFVSVYAEGIRSGAFPPNPTAPCPDYCASRTFCRRLKEETGDVMEELQDE